MPSNEYINKVIFGGDTLIDLTSDTIAANKVLTGYTAHDHTGATITGTCDYDAKTSDATATADEILATKTAYKNGAKVTGTMTNRGAVTGSIDTKAGEYTVPQGYHDGSGKVSIASAEQAKLIAANIRSGVTILGVAGSMSGSEDVKETSVSITPYTTSQSIQPSDLGDYNSITSISVGAIAYTETDNDYGGKTATIGTVAPST